MNKIICRALSVMIVTAGCGGARPQTTPPPPTTQPAPVMAGQTVMFFPVQYGSVPVADITAQHFAIEREKLDSEIAYWLPQLANNVQWVMPATIQRAITRSPTLQIDIHNLAVGSFQRAQVKRIGDPLFGDLRKLAAVLDARFAVIPVAAERIGATEGDARVQVATAVIDALNGTVLWFGVIESAADALGTEAGTASAAQAFARAFSGKKN
jgi:hypothetical protein